MAIKVPGSLGALQYITESTYGTTPTSTDFSYFGFMSNMQETGGGEEEGQIGDGSRIFETVLHKIRSAGFDATLSMFRDSGSEYYLKSLVGTAYAPTADLPSFSSFMKIDRDEYVMFTGCKIDTLVLASEGVGSKVTARLTVKALKHLPHQTSKAGYGSLGEENSGPTTKTPVIYDAYPTTSLSGNGATIPAKSFQYTISNNLEEEEGIISGEALAAGSGLVPGECNIELEYTLLSKSFYWDNLKLAGTDGITITHVIGEHTYMFTNCYIVTDDHPSRAQSSYDETVRFKAGGLTVS